MSNKTVGAVATVAALLLCGCASAQKISVTTTPPGAQVTLIRYGVTEAQGSVAGVSVGGLGGDFEDPPIVLGTSPLEYEFELEDSGQRVSAGGLSVVVVRRFTEGLIRAERDGAVAERRVRFGGDWVVVDLLLPDP